jgi:hypothetical protein
MGPTNKNYIEHYYNYYRLFFDFKLLHAAGARVNISNRAGKAEAEAAELADLWSFAARGESRHCCVEEEVLVVGGPPDRLPCAG